MSEIEQLRKDIEQAKEIMLRFYRQDRQALGLGEMFERLAKLEAEAAEKADPWREHKEVLSGRFHTQQGADHDEKLVLNYAMHLQQTNEKLAFKARLDTARIAELEADNARLERSVAGYKTAGDHTADLMRYMLDRKEVISQPAGYEAINEMQRLDARIAELEKELANRPVADPEPTKWGGKADGKWVVDGFGKPLRFYSREAAKYVFSDAVEIVPYTGEQS